jgi:diguanylate cyclase (GGDEF)-like protein/PAS domain S-box-containing protein
MADLEQRGGEKAEQPVAWVMSWLIRHRRAIFRHTLLSISFVLLYLLLNLPETIVFDHLGSSTWYPANGLVLAFMLCFSPWYGLLAALSDILARHLIYQAPLNSVGVILGAPGAAFCYAAAAYLLRGPLHIDRALRRGSDVIDYLAISTAAALAATATGVACLVADHTIAWNEYWHSGWRWFVGDEIGLVGLAPFLLIHVFPWIQKKHWWRLQAPVGDTIRPEARKFDAKSFLLSLPETLGQYVCLLAALCIMFWPPMGHLIFVCFIPVLWMAVRQGIGRVSSGILALNFGIVVAMHLVPQPANILSRIGLLMFVVSAAGLVVGSMVSDRLGTEQQLRERSAYLHSLIQNSPLGIVVLNQEGRVEIANDAFINLFLFEEQSDLMGSQLQELFPAEQPQDRPWSAQVVSGESLHRVLRRQRRDGKVLDLEMQAVPLVVDGEVRGAYALCRDISEQVRASQAEREHAAALNGLVKELEQQTDQMTVLNDMASMLACCANIKEACKVVQESTRKLFPEAIFVGLYTFRASRNLVEVATSWGDSESSQSSFGPEACWGLRRGVPYWSNPGAESIACTHLNEAAAHPHLCVPMVARGEFLGILSLGFACLEGEDSSSLHHSRQQLGLAVATQVALSVASLQSREELRTQSIRDPLTGLFNRRFMQESLEREMIRARRKDRPLSILFLDIDHFKLFNDTFGHEAGDFVLQSVAELLTRFFRGDDVACRWGGEEFAVILPESLSCDALERADALRAEVKKLILKHRGKVLNSVTLSIGVATFPEHGSNSEQLLRIADQCLYQSKASGRDCVTVATASLIRT